MAQRGLKPGQRHSGQFKKGFDPRRANVSEYRGIPLMKLARQHTEEALNALVECVQDKSAGHGIRIQAANHILDRGWGKPVSMVDLNVNETTDIREMSEQALLALITGDGQVIDGEFQKDASEDD